MDSLDTRLAISDTYQVTTLNEQKIISGEIFGAELSNQPNKISSVPKSHNLLEISYIVFC